MCGSSDIYKIQPLSKLTERQGRGRHKAMYVCRKVKNSQARTGHQRGMGGRWTDDDDTHERHTDTNRLTRHTAIWLPHTLSRRTHNSGPHPPCRPPQHSTVPRVQTRAQRHNRRQEVTCEARAGLLYLQQSLRPARHGRDRVWGLSEVSMDALLTG